MEKTFSFRDLDIWQLAMDLAVDIYHATLNFPSEERFGLTSQIRRSAVSLASNIAEGWGRGTQANLANYIRIARGSLCELETQMELANRLGFMPDDVYRRLQVDMLGRKSYAFLAKVEDNKVRENLAKYVTD